MKKGIEWLKDKIRSERECLALSLSKGQETMREYNFNNGKHGALVDVLKLINQLDEPEVLSQEWIRNNQERKGVHFFVNVTKLQNLVVPKKELPVIPKYVADWITKYRDKYDLYPALRLLENNTLVWGLIHEWYRMNTHKFVNAYLTGEYEVEEEPLYYALIKGHELLADHDALSFTYWNFNMSNGYLLHGNKFSKQVRFLTKMTKEDWNKLGINDSNADFVNVEN